ncbi:MAG: hypothetical protein ACERKN_06895 [Velocimicrobium sp.]
MRLVKRGHLHWRVNKEADKAYLYVSKVLQEALMLKLGVQKQSLANIRLVVLFVKVGRSTQKIGIEMDNFEKERFH